MKYFVLENLPFFKNYNIVTTNTTGSSLEPFGLTVKTKVRSGPLGGDQEIGALIAQGQVGLVFFFKDPLSIQSHNSDIEAFCRLCDVHDVAIATNPITAAVLVAALSQNESLEREVFNRYLTDSERVNKYNEDQQKITKVSINAHVYSV